MQKKQDTEASQKIRIKYEDMSAKYASQVVLNGSPEEILMDFSSGPVPDHVTGESVIPIHTRIALSHGAARRLLSALQRTFKGIEVNQQEAGKSSLPEV